MSQRSGYVIMGENYSYICVQSQLKKKGFRNAIRQDESMTVVCVFWFDVVFLSIVYPSRNHSSRSFTKNYSSILSAVLFVCLLGYFIFFIRRCLMFTRNFRIFFLLFFIWHRHFLPALLRKSIAYFRVVTRQSTTVLFFHGRYG